MAKRKRSKTAFLTVMQYPVALMLLLDPGLEVFVEEDGGALV